MRCTGLWLFGLLIGLQFNAAAVLSKYCSVSTAPGIESLYSTTLNNLTLYDPLQITAYERLITSRQSSSGMDDVIKPRYLLVQPRSHSDRALSLFHRIRNTEAGGQIIIRRYLQILRKREKVLRHQTREYLNRSKAEWPPEEKRLWFYQALLAHKQLFSQGVDQLEALATRQSDPSLTYFLCALFIQQSPFSRWPSADHYLRQKAEHRPDIAGKILFYRHLMLNWFGQPGQPLPSESNSRQWMGMKLFAAAEHYSFQEEVDELLVEMNSLFSRKATLEQRVTDSKQNLEQILAECETWSRQEEERKTRCHALLKEPIKETEACNGQWLKLHKPRSDECKKRMERFRKTDFSIKPCSASSKRCVSRATTIKHQEEKLKSMQKKLHECQRWEKERLVWADRCQKSIATWEQHNKRCLKERSEIRQQLTHCSEKYDGWQLQTEALALDLGHISTEESAYEQKKAELRQRIADRQAELDHDIAMLQAQVEANPLLNALETLGRGEDPLSEGIERTADNLISISYEHFPTGTEQVLNALSHVDQTFDAVVEFIDDSTGNRGSAVWQQLDESTQARILGAGQVLSVLVPAARAKGLAELVKAPSPALKKDHWHPDSVASRHKEWEAHYGGLEEHQYQTSRGYILPPEQLKAFPEAYRVKEKTPVQGGGGKRYRWKDKKGQIYEWDYQHGAVEKYDKRGHHLGEYDPVSGQQVKLADKKRTVEP